VGPFPFELLEKIMECLPPRLEGAPSIQESGHVLKQVAAGEHFAILCSMNPFKVPLFETRFENTL